jgi:hypothetical protein
MKILKKNNHYYRQLCEGQVPTQEQGTNPIEILDCGLDKSYEDRETQVEPEEAASMEEQYQKEKEQAKR